MTINEILVYSNLQTKFFAASSKVVLDVYPGSILGIDLIDFPIIQTFR